MASRALLKQAQKGAAFGSASLVSQDDDDWDIVQRLSESPLSRAEVDNAVEMIFPSTKQGTTGSIVLQEEGRALDVPGGLKNQLLSLGKELAMDPRVKSAVMETNQVRDVIRRCRVEALPELAGEPRVESLNPPAVVVEVGGEADIAGKPECCSKCGRDFDMEPASVDTSGAVGEDSAIRENVSDQMNESPAAKEAGKQCSSTAGTTEGGDPADGGKNNNGGQGWAEYLEYGLAIAAVIIIAVVFKRSP